MKVFYNAKIYKNDGSPVHDTAMAVEGGIIKGIGNDEEIFAFADKASEKIDLGGRLLLPGFVDSHLHFLEYAYEKSFVDLSGAKSIDDMLAILCGALPEAQAKNRALRGTGFDQNFWEKQELPNKDDLDKVSEEIPVIIRRTCHHVTVCNTPALEIAGLLESNPDGMLWEDEQNIIEEALPPLSLDDVKALISDASKDVLCKGITEIQTDDLSVIPREIYGKTILDAYMELDKEGLLPIRVYEQCNIPSKERLLTFLNDGYFTGKTCGKFTIGPLKLFADGALGAKSAAMIKSYPGYEDNYGILNYEDDELFELVDMANRAGMQIAIHGIGDRGIEQIISAFENALAKFPRRDHRHGIVHCQITHPCQLDRMKESELMAYIQPVFIRADRHIVEERVGKELATSSYDWRRMTDMGIHLAGGSDCPVEHFDILPNIYYAVKRKEKKEDSSWFPEKSLTLREAINLFTAGGAYASFSEKTRGKLIEGYTADFCVIDRDITSMEPEALIKAEVTMTVVGGEVKYEGR